MDSNKDIRLIVKCAKMYYEENMKQEDIGLKLRISKATVSRLLNQAKVLNIVRITVQNPYSKDSIELEKQLEDKLMLKEVIVADANSDDEEEIKNAIAREAAKYLQRVLKQDSLIGVSSGTTLAAIPKFIQDNRNNRFIFVPLVGGNGQIRAELQSNTVAFNFARAFKSDYRILHSPAMVEKLESKSVFTEDPGIKSILSMTKKLDVALIGIGTSTSQSTVNYVAEFIKPEEIKRMNEEGAIADVCNYFIDANGSGENFEVNKRIIGIDLEDLKNTPLTIGIAGGISKVDAIKCVLNAKLADVLITDINTAKEILLR